MKRAADIDFALSPPADSPSPSSHTSELSGPPRKRARSELTPEERREARAHRNRIAAQNSRDRRKAQFAYLERRVAELEEENRQLRAGMGLTAPNQPPQEQKDEERRKELAREMENEELRHRVKTLEAGWEAVMKALAASGLPLNLPSVPPSSSSVPSLNASAPSTSGQTLSTTTFPVFTPRVPPFPSPAPSDASSSSSTLFDSDDFDSTRHLARLELNIPPSSSYPPVISLGESGPASADEIAMDDLFREILAPSPVSPQAPLPAGSSPIAAHSPTRSRSQSVSEIKLSPAPVPTAPVNPTLPEIDWENEVQMQTLLAMLPVAQQNAAPTDADAVSGDFPSALDLDLCAWDMAGVVSAPAGSSSVSVF
ncbi:hypothetical protein BN946_scf184782.g5 [Trametes cinnabarina]|uniref:X-box-binding protein 1 n=1 Tax=Pycnoporus cinnabarinus TaxID=5643 RepID=A0A060S3G4_PYCCI|nr:hypothetical protein BN946_scf184782.g5 [Trametes cinnabarina]